MEYSFGSFNFVYLILFIRDFVKLLKSFGFGPTEIGDFNIFADANMMQMARECNRLPLTLLTAS